jgi:hypothetical protein
VLPEVALPPDDATALALLCTRVSELCSQIRWVLKDDELDSSDDESESDVDLDPHTKATEDSMTRWFRRVKTYVNCLTDLDAALTCPALEPEHDEHHRPLKPEQRSAHDYLTDLIRAKFPKAATDLLINLGQASWTRYQRMQSERETNVQNRLSAVSDWKSHVANTEFQDSGIGTSLSSVPSSYAGSTFSSSASIGGTGRGKIPPLPTEAKDGTRFECMACGKFIRATNNREWRRAFLSKYYHDFANTDQKAPIP